MQVPFVDLRAQFAALRGEIVPRVQRVMEDASFILGPDVGRFEENFARHVGVRHCVGVESGTAALQLALQALGIGPDDQVIIPANTYIASAIAVSAIGAEPVLVECDENYLIDASRLESALTPRTKAVMPVHLYGQMTPMEPISSFARAARPARDRGRVPGARRVRRAARRRGASATSDASASIPARIWAPMAMPARSSRTTRNSPTS